MTDSYIFNNLFQGKTLSVELNELGTLMWTGNDRGYIEVSLYFWKAFNRSQGTSAKYSHMTINALNNSLLHNKFLNKLIVQVHYRDLAKSPLSALGFEHTALQLASSCQSIYLPNRELHLSDRSLFLH